MAFETGRPTSADPSLVNSRSDFADFLEEALADFRETGNHEWENGTLDRFLDGLAAFAAARVVDRGDQEAASWRIFAEIIVAATGYE